VQVQIEVYDFPTLGVIPDMDTNLSQAAPLGAIGGAPVADAMPRIHLTSREIEIVRLVVRGHSNAEIAEKLGIQLQAVKNLLSALYGKLGVSTRLQLAVLALRTGFDGA
jgi:DNA-binding NarL/FixJ family response regulator